MKVIVDREKWGRGEGVGSGNLLNSTTGKMCCLGFACLAAGLTEDEIVDKLMPAYAVVGKVIPEPLAPLVSEGEYDPNTEVANRLSRVNDQSGNENREEELTALGALVGLEFEFVN